MAKIKQIFPSVFDYFRRRGRRDANIEPDRHPWPEIYQPEAAAICPPVAISMKEIVQAVATQPPIVRGTKYKRLFERPNEAQTWQDLFISALNSFCLYGGSYLYGTRMKSGTIVELLELPADEMKLVRENGRFGVRRLLTGELFSFKDICFTRDFLGLGFNAVSRMEPVWPDIRAINSAYKWINDSFMNSLNLKTVVSMKGSLSDSDLNKIKQQLHGQLVQNGNPTSPGGFIVVGREGKVEQLRNVSPADVELQGFLQAEVRIAAAIFGAPPFSVGSGGDTKYSNHSAETSRFLRSGVNPVTVRYADTLSHFLGVDVTFDDWQLYKGDMQSMVDILVDLVVAGILSQNEARNMLQFASKSIPDMDIPARAGNLRRKADTEPDVARDDDDAEDRRQRDRTDNGRLRRLRRVA